MNDGRQIRRPVKAALIALTALAILAGALLTATTAPRTLDAAPVDLAVPALDPDQLGQWCVDRQAQGTAGLSSRARNWLADCVAVFGGGLHPTASGSPSPSPTASPAPTSSSPAPSPSTSSPSPSPTVTVNPTPSPTGPVLGCMPVPSRCGWPDATNTGVPAGTVLAVRTGKVMLGAGAQLLNTQVTGCVQITGPNVVIRNVRIIVTCSYAAIDLEDSNTKGALIEDVEIDMSRLADTAEFTGRLNQRSITGDDFTARRIWWHGGSDCVHYGSRVVIEDSFCDVAKIPAGYPGDPHIDGFQSAGGSGVVIRHNTIRNPNDQTSAIINGTTPGASGPQTNVRIVGNLMAGGGYTVYCNAHNAATSPTTEFSGNRIAKAFYTWPIGSGHPVDRGGYWGYTTDCTGVPGYSSNVVDETGGQLPGAENPRAE